MIEIVGVVPATPLLPAALAGDAAGETADLRAACRAVARRLGATGAAWTVVGADTPTGRWDPVPAGTFRGFGVDVVVGAGGLDPSPVTPDPALPLPLLVAGWLHDAAPGAGPFTGLVLDPGADPADAARTGRELAGGEAPTALLVVGDGAATLTSRAPGALHPRAAAHDQRVGAALAGADPAPLAGLDPADCAELMVGGRVPWQVLAAAATGAAWRPAPLYSGHPYGVGYHVAVWERDR